MRIRGAKGDIKDTRKVQIHYQYGVIKSQYNSPRETPQKFLQRKPQRKTDRVLNNVEKKKCDKKINPDQLCYISQTSIREASIKSERSLSGYQAQVKTKEQPIFTSRKRITSTPPKRSVSKEANSQNNTGVRSRFRRMTADQNEKQLVDALKKEVTQLKAMNKILKDELHQVENQKERQVKLNKTLNQKVDELNKIIWENKKKMKENERQLLQLKKNMKSKEEDYNKLQKQLEENIKPNFTKKKQSDEELERMLSDINKGFDDIFVDSKIILSTFEDGIPHNESHILPIEKQPVKESQQLIIYNLKEKIKYQDMEIGMLKRYKFEYLKMEKEYEKYKLQMKTLNKKFMRQQQQKLLEKQREKERVRAQAKIKEGSIISEGKDDSISFDLSKDETTDEI